MQLRLVRARRSKAEGAQLWSGDVATCVRLARTMYIRCIHGIIGKEITKCTVIHDVYKYLILANPTCMHASLGAEWLHHTVSYHGHHGVSWSPWGVCTVPHHTVSHDHHIHDHIHIHIHDHHIHDHHIRYHIIRYHMATDYAFVSSNPIKKAPQPYRQLLNLTLIIDVPVRRILISYHIYGTIQ